MRLTRRATLKASVAALLLNSPVQALSGGAASQRIALRVPWPVHRVDPHRLDDAMAAIFGNALFDTLYVRSADDARALLAESFPSVEGQALRVRVRSGLTFASGRNLEASDVAFSIARSRRFGAAAWLYGVPVPRVEGTDLLFAMTDRDALVRALSSPLTAIVPRAFAPENPDGTGAFRWGRKGASVILSRNPSGAYGASLLDEVEVLFAPDLSSSLRAFEGNTDDVGWLGAGLHETRPKAVPFDRGPVGFATLLTGSGAGSWDAPGIPQRLCDAIDPTRVSYLGLGTWTKDDSVSWGGAPTEVLVRDDCPWLLETAKAVAGALSKTSHELTVKSVTFEEWTKRKAARGFALAVDFVRPLDHTPLGSLIALASSADAKRAEEIARHPPKLIDANPRVLCRTLRLGIVGEARVRGAHAPDVALVPAMNGGVEWGSSSRVRKSEP